MRFIFTIAAFAALATALPQFGGRWPWAGVQGQQVRPRPVIVTGSPQSGTILASPTGSQAGTVSLGNGQQLPTVIVTDGGNSNGSVFTNDNDNSDANVVIVTGNGVDSSAITIT